MRAERELVVSVNLSGRQFQQPDLVEVVRRVLTSASLAPRALKLEITESVLVADAPGTVARLLALKELGVRLAIDDFGTGYSSLSYLKRFTVDAIKIDQYFVRGLGRDPHDMAIVRAIAMVAHALGLDVTAEGIENDEQLDCVLSAGCDRAQGYYFARPMQPTAVTTGLRDNWSALPLRRVMPLATSPESLPALQGSAEP